MAHKKAGVGSVRQKGNVAGKRLGIKKYAGQTVIAGNIIVKQKGTKIHPGVNTSMGRDFTIFSLASGIVRYRVMTGPKRGRKIVDVVNPVTVSADKVIKAVDKVNKTTPKTSKTATSKAAKK